MGMKANNGLSNNSASEVGISVILWKMMVKPSTVYAVPFPLYWMNCIRIIYRIVGHSL